MNLAQLLLPLTLVFLVAGCSTSRTLSRNYTPQELYSAACELGVPLQSVKGDVMLRLKSEEISGQFPAQIQAKAPDHLRIEVTNFLGGTEAVISVKRNQYEVLRFRGGEASEKVQASTWSGIPLQWAADLFLGKIPCPGKGSHLKMSTDSEGGLTLEMGGEKGNSQLFVYSYQEKDGKLLPAALHWERQGVKSASADFKFDEFEKKTLSPLKWEAHSNQGGVKVRWKGREVIQFE